MFLLVIIRDTILQQRNAREIWEVVSFLFLVSLLSTFLLLLLVELIAQKAVWAKLKLINRKLTISFIFWSFPQNKITSEKKSPSVCDHVFIMIIFSSFKFSKSLGRAKSSICGGVGACARLFKKHFCL